MVTKDEIRIAKELDLVELVKSLGFELKKLGVDTYAWSEHESFRISRHKGFYWHSRGFGGDNISCIQEMCSCNFTKAMEIIIGKSSVSMKLAKNETEETVETSTKNKYSDSRSTGWNGENQFCLPKKAENGKRAFAYLVKTRGIDPEILKEEFRRGHIYQEAKTGNAVFVGYQGDKAVSATLRGVGEKRFVKIKENSDCLYPYRIGDESESLYVFESSIDILSYISMYGKDEIASYITLNGLSTNAIDEFIKNNSECKTIIVCTDNDDAGEAVYERLCKREDLSQLILREKPRYKDFNEDLLSKMKVKGMSI